MLACQPKEVSALAIGHATVALADTWATQRSLALIRERGYTATEENPLTRPFHNHGKALAYASTYSGLVGLSWVETKMRKSENWTRKVWWMPRVALLVASAVGVANNVSQYNYRVENLSPANKGR